MAVTLLNPAGLAALAAIAIPIAVHLLLRRRARRVAFPSLRFIQPTNAAAVRLRSITDWPLLIVRCATVAAAAVAVARPIVVTPARREAWNARLARAVVVDVSASSPPAGPAAGAGGDEPASFRSVVIEAAALDRGVAEAVRWLEAAPPARRELVLVSDFQRGSIDEIVLAGVPASVGIRFRPSTASRASALDPPEAGIDVRAPARDRAMVGAALTAAAEEKRGQPPYAAGEEVSVPFSIVFLTQGAEPMSFGRLRAPWMAAAAAALEGRRVGSIDERTMVVALEAPAASFELPLAMRAARTALLAPAAWSELEPDRISEASLAAWSRPAPQSDVPRVDHAEEDDARGLWLGALALVAVETWLRRRLDAARAAPRAVGEAARAA